MRFVTLVLTLCLSLSSSCDGTNVRHLRRHSLHQSQSISSASIQQNQQQQLRQDPVLMESLNKISNKAYNELNEKERAQEDIRRDFVTALFELARERAKQTQHELQQGFNSKDAMMFVETEHRETVRTTGSICTNYGASNCPADCWKQLIGSVYYCSYPIAGSTTPAPTPAPVVYHCTCNNGVHAVDSDCTLNGEKCVGCKQGYKLSGTKCVPNSYLNIYAYPQVKANCWAAGTVCWDDMGSNSCHLNCCSQNYRQAYSWEPNAGKDICTPVGPCWNKGTKCWDNDGEDSCKWRCCSHTWYHDDKLNYDVCDAPAPFSTAVIGWDTTAKIDDQLRLPLILGSRSCWTAGTKCWNNGGQDSCWERCCSKAYYHDASKNSDVCAPIPADNKCYAQYTPCWNSLPVPQGNFYVEVRNNQKVYYPSCFQCCARVRTDGGTHWPAWTEYYIGAGNHDSTSEATHWWDAFVAGAQAANPVQFIIDAAVPTDPNRQKRGGNDIALSVAQSIAQHGAEEASKAAVKAAVQAINAGLDADPITGVVGVAFSFFYGFFSKLAEPKWDLCD